MSRRFPSTSLPISNDPSEIRKGMLDLLDKINTISPSAGSASSVATVDGPTTYTVPDGISVVLVTTGANNVTVYLPEARYSVAREIEVHKVDAGAGTVSVSVSPGSTDTIGPATTFDLYAQYDYGKYISSGNLWLVDGTNNPLLQTIIISDISISVSPQTWGNFTSFTVPAGIWDIEAQLEFYLPMGAVTWTRFYACLSTSSSSLSDQDANMAHYQPDNSAAGAAMEVQTQKTIRRVLTSATTFYINGWYRISSGGSFTMTLLGLGLQTSHNSILRCVRVG